MPLCALASLIAAIAAFVRDDMQAIKFICYSLFFSPTEIWRLWKRLQSVVAASDEGYRKDMERMYFVVTRGPKKYCFHRSLLGHRKKISQLEMLLSRKSPLV